MNDGDFREEGGESSREGRGGIPVHEHNVEAAECRRRPKLCERTMGHLGERLARPHDREVRIGHDLALPQRVFQHLGLLPGGDYAEGKARIGAEGANNRRELDRLGTGPEDHSDGLHRRDPLC